MRKLFYLTVIFLGLLRITPAQTIPKELWGTWVVRREVPASTISCWGETEAKTLIGTEVEYSVGLFRWQTIVTKNPNVETTTLTADQFHDENSGGGASDSQVTFQQLGIKTDKATQVVIRHSDANITGATIEIPGDRVLLKGKNTIIFSVCNDYFEAKRGSGAARASAPQRCRIYNNEPAQRFFADPDGKHGWREYRNAKEVPELENDAGEFAQLWIIRDGNILVRTQAPGEDFTAYTDYCFDPTGQLIHVRFQLRTAWGWGYREEGAIRNAMLARDKSEFFNTKTEAHIARPEQAGDIPDALKPILYLGKSQLPFFKLLS